MISEDDLSKLAEAALLEEAKRGALRAELAGPSGWLKPKLPPTNKMFLKNTLKGAVASNQVKDKRRRYVRETKLEQFEEKMRDRKRYKKLYLKASTKVENKNHVTVTKKCNEDGKDKRNHKPVNGILWDDDNDVEGGLNISCSVPATKRKAKDSKDSTQKAKQNLPRNIAFINEMKIDRRGVT